MQTELLQQYQLLLNKLALEMEAYPSEESIWAISGDIKNSAGTLCYHLCGNLNHYIGKAMGGTDFVRNRPLEFSIRDVPKAELVSWVKETSSMLAEVIPGVDLTKPFPKKHWNIELNQGGALLRLLWHLGWHLGQINYHRQLVALST